MLGLKVVDRRRKKNRGRFKALKIRKIQKNQKLKQLIISVEMAQMFF